MALETNLNVSPYFDDFSQEKDFYKILFQPGVAVQARELNQLQTILQQQIEKFGDNVFRRGTIIEGCSITTNERVPYVKINDLTTDGLQVDVNLYNNLSVKNSANLVAHIVKTTSGLQSTAPDLNTLFVTYTNSGDNFETDTFSAGENLTVFSKSYPIFNIKVNDGASKFSNSDTIVVMSALALQYANGGKPAASAFPATTVIRNGVANAVIIEANSTANSQALILKVRPEYPDLLSANTIKFRFAAGEAITGVATGNTANVVSIVGSGAVGSITTDSLGKVTAVQVLSQGSGYYVEPHVTIANNATGVVTTATELQELELVAENFLTTVQVANATAVPIGTGYGVSISNGTIYQKGFFSRVGNQFEIVNKYSNTGFDKAVGFQTSESIVNSNQDQSLLDNATGTFNYTAPGADRLKLTPVIVVKTKAEAAANNEFLPIIEFTDGSPYRMNQDTVYNVINRQLAKRTFEESGNYVIDQFLTLTKDSPTFAENSSLVKLNIDPGKAYLNGIRIETIRNYKQNINKALTTVNEPASQTRLGYGNYVVVDELAGTFNFDIGQQVDLHADHANYISTSASTISAAGTKIGTARIRAFVYQDGDIGKFDCKYRMYLFDINMNSGRSFSSVKSVYYGSGNKAIADVVLDANLNAVLQDTRDSSLLFKLKNATSNASNITYQFRTINSTDLTADSSGEITITLPSGQLFPYTEELNSSEIRDLVVTPKGNFKSQTPATGTIEVFGASPTVNGTGTTFNTQFAPGDWVQISNSSGYNANTTYAQISTIASNTSMTLATNAGKTYSGGSITLYFPQNVPISLSNRSNKFANVDTAGEVMTIFVGNTIANATSNAASSMGVSVVYNASLNDISSTSKESKRGNYARIRVANNNTAGILGPWPLGVSDVYRLRGVWQKDATAQDVTFNVSTNVNAAAGFITITNNPFANGDSLVYSNAAGVGVVGGLTNGTTYYAVYSNTSGFALSATRGGANLTLASNSSSTHKFTGNTMYFTENTYGVTEVTNQFFVDNRQNEDFLDISRLVRKPGFATLSSTDVLLVKFDAFTAASGPKTVSSYTIDDTINLQALVSDTSINTMEIPEFEGRTGTYYDLRDYIDLRPAAANTINYITDISSVASGANSASIFNPTLPSNATYFSTASAFFPVPNSTLTANVSSYLGRLDRVIINSVGNFEVKSGEPGTQPKLPPEQDNSLTLQVYNVPPYPSLPEVLSAEMSEIVDTNVESSIAGKRKVGYTVRPLINAYERERIQQRRYTMADIGSLDKRIKTLEYYVSFTLAEALAKSRFIPSSNDAALDRFKFGFFVDPFTDYTYSEIGNPEFYATIRDDKLGPFLKELNLQFKPDGIGQVDGILTLPYNEVVIGEQSAATAGPIPTTTTTGGTTGGTTTGGTTTGTTTTDTTTGGTTGGTTAGGTTTGGTTTTDTSGQVTTTTVTQRVETVIQQQRSTARSDNGTVFEEFVYRFSSLQGPVEFYTVSRDNNFSVSVYQSTSENGPWTKTQSSASAVSITTTDIARLNQINQLNGTVEHPGELRRKSYPTSIDSGTFLEDQFKLLWTHSPTSGEYVKIRVYKGTNKGAQGRSGTYGYLLQYPTDSVSTTTQTTTNLAAYVYNGIVHSVSPDTFTVSESFAYGNDYYYTNVGVGEIFYIADSQKFLISISGLKPNTNHTFNFDGEDRTSKCSQVRTSTTNTTGLRSDENGTITFDFYYDAGLDETGSDIQARNRVISNIMGQKRFAVENSDGTSKAQGVISLAFYSALQDIVTGLNISESLTSSATSTTVSTTQSTLPAAAQYTGGNSGDSLTATGSYNVQTLDVNQLRELDIVRGENVNFR